MRPARSTAFPLCKEASAGYQSASTEPAAEAARPLPLAPIAVSSPLNTSLAPAPTLLSTLERFVPALATARNYSRLDARGDIVAGLSVATVAVPQAMAYAMIVGLPPQYGLYTAIVMTSIGAIFDSSRQLINGPTNAISIALLSMLATVDGTNQRVQLAVSLAFLIGLFQLGITLLRLGDLTRYISHSVIVGFTAGASLLLVLDQTKNILGLTAAGDVHDHFLVRFYRTLTEGGHVHPLTVGVGIGSAGLVLLLRWAKKRLRTPLLPELLITVAVVAAVSAALDLAGHGVKIIGDIPSELPPFQIPYTPLYKLRALSSAAFAIAVLGLLEAVSMAKAIAAVSRQKLDLNQQCLSEALANIGGSFFQCMPGSGSLTRSAINQQAGARTQWSGVVSAVAVAVIMMVFAPYAKFIPRSALAAILILTAAKMVNLHELRSHVKTSRFDAIIVASTAISAFAISIEFCVLIGVFTSFLLAVPRAGKIVLTEFVVGSDGHIHERLPDDVPAQKVLVFGLEGEMFFGSSVSLDEHFDAILERVTKDTRVIVLRLKRARNPDAVGLGLLDGFIERASEAGVTVVVCGVRKFVVDVFERHGLTKKLDPSNIFLEQPVRQTSTLLAVKHAYELAGETWGGAAGDESAAPQPLFYTP